MSTEYESARHTTTPRLTGHEMVDRRLDKVGTITDVVFDDTLSLAKPRWAIVKTGRLWSEHIVPLEDSYFDDEGRLVVPLTKTTIRRAPRPPRDHVLTIETRRGLRDYYGVAA